VFSVCLSVCVSLFVCCSFRCVACYTCVVKKRIAYIVIVAQTIVHGLPERIRKNNIACLRFLFVRYVIGLSRALG